MSYGADKIQTIVVDSRVRQALFSEIAALDLYRNIVEMLCLVMASNDQCLRKYRTHVVFTLPFKRNTIEHSKLRLSELRSLLALK